jgi:poly(3-hydroxybutyrate) depolymerase
MPTGSLARAVAGRAYPLVVRTKAGSRFLLSSQDGAPGANLLFQLLDSILPTLPIDPGRIYLTGQSQGGYGAFYMVMKRPDLFAAAIPVCGGGDPAEASKFRDVPMWAFHGIEDPVVAAQRSREMVGSRPRFVEICLHRAGTAELALRPTQIIWL